MMVEKYIQKKLPGEKIILKLQPHWLNHIKNYLFFALLGLIPVFLYLFLNENFPGLFTNHTIFPIMLLATSLFYLFLWNMIFTTFIDFHLDMWIITNKRIIGMEQHGLFNRHIYEHTIDQIEDVSTKQKGMLETFFNYGTVYTQTASEASPSSFEHIPNPVAVTKVINSLLHKKPEKEHKKEEKK